MDSALVLCVKTIVHLLVFVIVVLFFGGLCKCECMCLNGHIKCVCALLKPKIVHAGLIYLYSVLLESFSG